MRKIIMIFTAVFLAFGMADAQVFGGQNQFGYIEQPDTAGLSQPLEVYILDVYAVMSLSNTLATAVVKDTFLFSAYLPSGFTASGLDYTIDQDCYQVLNDYANVDPDSIDINHLIDSLNSLFVKATPYTGFDASLTAVHDPGGRAPVSFIATQAVDLPAGTPIDSVIGGTNIYLKFVAVVMRLNLTSAAAAGDYVLGYFAGFDPYNITSGGMLSENSFSDGHPIHLADIGIEGGAGQGGLNRLQMTVSPNPAGPATALSYFIPADLGRVRARLRVFDVSGREHYAKTFLPQAGWNSEPFGQTLADGIYILRLEAGTKLVSRRVTVLK